MSNHASEGEYAELALAVYVEELVQDKQVLYVGGPEGLALDRLAERAQRVDVVTPRARARGTKRGGRVSTRPWPGPADEGRWDVIVVPDLPAAGLADEDAVEDLGRWLKPGGVLVAGAPDPGGPAAGSTRLAYEDFFDLLDGAFDSVRMVGQAPFAGWSVVDFAPVGELEVTFDGSLLEGAGEGAQRYVALCGDHDVVLDSYSVVQVPTTVAPSRGAAPSPNEAASAAGNDRRAGEGRAAELAERLREQQDALDAANVHAEELERELDSLRARLSDAQGDLEASRADVDHAEARQRALADRIQELESDIAALGADGPAATDEEYARLETALRERGLELTEHRAELQRRATLVRDLVEELAEQRRRPAPEASPAAETAPTAPTPARDAAALAATVPPEARATLEWTPNRMQEALHAQVADAVERAMTAETEKAELSFRLDEVRGELAVTERRAAQELEELRRLEAALRGTVRGLNARLAEVTELYQQTHARLTLAEDDRRTTESRNLALTRQVAEIREQLELEIARASVQRDASALEAQRTSEDAATEQTPLGALASGLADATSPREEALLEALERTRDDAAEVEEQRQQGVLEAQAAREALVDLEERIDGMRRGYELRLLQTLSELETLGPNAERALLQVGELTTRLELRERSEAALRGEIAGLRMRLADREAAVRELSERGAPATSDGGAARSAELEAKVRELTAALEANRSASEADADADEDRVHDLERKIEALTSKLEAARADDGSDEAEQADSEAEALRARIAELETSLAAASSSGPLDDVRAQLGARDAMVARQQAELTHAAEQRRTLEEAIDAARREAAELRVTRDEVEAVADVKVEEGERELDELMSRLEQSEAQRRMAEEALAGARAILAGLVDHLPEASEPRAGATSDTVELRRLRGRITDLDAEASDRELLLRSLTAQLQERDDRIRALERARNGEGAADSSEVLREKLLEMEERVARLSAELGHERDARRRDERN